MTLWRHFFWPTPVAIACNCAKRHHRILMLETR